MYACRDAPRAEDGDGKRKKKGAAASSSKIAVLRDPFASFDQVYRPLSQVHAPRPSTDAPLFKGTARSNAHSHPPPLGIACAQVVRPLGSSALAVHSDVNQPHLRVVVDEYVRDEEDGG